MEGGLILDKMEVEEGVLSERPEVEEGLLLERSEVEGGALLEMPEVEGGELLERTVVEEEIIFSEGSDIVIKERFEVEGALLVGFCIVKDQ